MLGAGQAQAEIARVQLGEYVGSVPFKAFGARATQHIELYAGVVPDDSPLRGEDVDVFVAAQGEAESVGAGRAYASEVLVIGTVFVEHTEGQSPAVVDLNAKPLQKRLMLRTALPVMLKKAGVRRGLVSPDRSNVDPKTAEEAGYTPDKNGSVLVLAA